MKNIAAEIRPAIDLAKLTVAWELLDAREARTLKEIALEKGRLLKEARKAFPRSGPAARGWGEFLTKWKIAEQTARDYMKLAGYVEEIATKFVETPIAIPTYAEAGIVKPKKPSRASLDASVEVEDSDEDIDEVAQDSFATDTSDHQGYLAAYLIRADQAARFAIYRGSVSKDVIAMARRVAEAWMKLVNELEKKQ